MKKIPITAYITVNATEEAHSLTKQYGLNPNTLQEIYRSLNAIMKKYPEEAYRDFAMIHPDRKMILDSVDEEKPVVQVQQKESVSGADGKTQYKCGERTSGADGNSGGFQFDLKKNLPFIGLSAIFLTGLIILVKTV